VQENWVLQFLTRGELLGRNSWLLETVSCVKRKGRIPTKELPKTTCKMLNDDEGVYSS